MELTTKKNFLVGGEEHGKVKLNSLLRVKFLNTMLIIVKIVYNFVNGMKEFKK